MADALWILVANASRARLFSTDERAEKWDLREEFYHEESRQHSVDLLNQEDNPNAGTLRKPSAENAPNGRQSLEHGRFARELSDRLERGLALTAERVGSGRYRVSGGAGDHWVDLATPSHPRCDCGDHVWRDQVCKHILAALLREGNEHVVRALATVVSRARHGGAAPAGGVRRAA